MDVLLATASVFAGAVLSGFFSWCFSRRYYLKALDAQAREASGQIAKLTELVEQGRAAADARRALELQKRIEECVDEYRRVGTPVRLIDRYKLTPAEKAELLDTVMMRVKGRRPKTNKYRETEGRG